MNHHTQLMRIWSVMDDCIRTGVSTSETVLPGRLQLRRKAPILYKRLMRGYVFATHFMHSLSLKPPPRRLYHGIASPDFQAIGSGWPPAAAAVVAPGSEQNGLENSAAVRPRAATPTRVVGSLHHAVPPMPPVSVRPFTTSMWKFHAFFLREER